MILEHELDGKTIYSFYGHLATYTGVHLHFAVLGDYCKSPVGRANDFTGDKTVWDNVTFYNLKYIIENGKLPE